LIASLARCSGAKASTLAPRRHLSTEEETNLAVALLVLVRGSTGLDLDSLVVQVGRIYADSGPQRVDTRDVKKVGVTF
jgi:hypothetical protein